MPLSLQEETTNKHRVILNQAYNKEYSLYNSMLKGKAENLFIFNKYILKSEEGTNFKELAPIHKEMCNFVSDEQNKKKLLLIPRGHLKTKLITIGYSLQRIALDHKVRGLIYSATWQMAVDIQTAIQKGMQGEKFIELYGDLYSNAKEWSQDRTRLSVNETREPTLTAAGIENNLVGGHYDFIIMDDVVNRDNIATTDQILKVKNRYKDSLDLLEPNGQLIVIGTRWDDSDLYGWIMDPDSGLKDSYNIMVKRAYEGDLLTGEGFTPLWNKFTREELTIRLKEEGWAHFSAQYLNDPVPEEDALFKRSWFSYYEGIDQLKGKILNKFLTIDPAISEAKYADYTAFVVVGVDQYNYVYILDIVRERMSPNRIIDTIFRLKERWDIREVGIEMVAFQKALAYSLREDPRFKLRPFPVTELKPNDRTKDQRIKGLQPLYENGKIIHNRLLQTNIYLEDELVRFPRATHDDIIDALAYIPDMIYPAKQPTARKQGHRWLY